MPLQRPHGLRRGTPLASCTARAACGGVVPRMWCVSARPMQPDVSHPLAVLWLATPATLQPQRCVWASGMWQQVWAGGRRRPAGMALFCGRGPLGDSRARPPLGSSSARLAWRGWGPEGRELPKVQGELKGGHAPQRGVRGAAPRGALKTYYLSNLFIANLKTATEAF